MATTNENPRLIDLDAARAARAAERGEPPQVFLNGRTYTLPDELPARFLDAITEDRFEDAFGTLFGEDVDVGALVDGFSYEDMVELAHGIAGAYGIDGDLGNLRASGGSSSNTSSR